MIKPGKNRKRCSVEGCDNYIFSSGLCKFHQSIKHGGSPVKRNKIKKNTKIKSKSDKRKNDEVLYQEAKDNVRKHLISINRWSCFFTNTPLPDNYNRFHHLKKRTGNMIHNELYIVPALDEPHLNYHDLSVDKLIKKDWYEIFMENLKEKDYSLWIKETRKQFKK